MHPVWQNIFRKKNKESHLKLTLHQVPVFEGLSDRELSQIEAIVYNRNYRKGESIFQEDTPGLGMYIILKGEVVITGTSNGESEIELARLRSGDFFGEVSLIDDANRSASAKAVTPCELVAFFRDELMEILTRSPKLGNKIILNLARIIAQRLRQTNELLQNHMPNTPTDIV